jgi:uncharacterized cupredoxin-like copper-binding protein
MKKKNIQTAQISFQRNNKLEIDLIVSIMATNSYGYTCQPESEVGHLTFNGQTIEVAYKNYEAAYMINEVKNLAEKGEHEVIMKMKKVLVNSWK